MKYLSKNNRKTALFGCGSIVFLLLSCIIGILAGAAELTLPELLGALFDGEKTSYAARILWLVRIPRVGAALICGAALAVSGAVIQGVLANHLASPGMIGVNAAKKIVDVFLATAFEGGRHQRRVDKMMALEQE